MIDKKAKKNIIDIFRKNHIPVGFETEKSIKDCPVQVFFLEEDFIRHYYPIAKLHPEHLEQVLVVAKKIRYCSSLRCLAWHFYRMYCFSSCPKDYQFPEFIASLKYETGILYILILLSLIPLLEARAKRERFPLSFARAAASRIGTLTDYFAKAYNGRFGIRPKSMPFMLNFKNDTMFRIGRFDFDLVCLDDDFPEIWTQNDKVTAFCQGNWNLSLEGDRIAPGKNGEIPPAVRINANNVCGWPIDFATGLAIRKKVCLDINKWQRKAGPGDWALHFHIPGGGGMRPEICEQSFQEALRFFAERYPDKPIKLIWSNSWIFSSDYLEYLPDSNIAALIRRSRLFPVVSTGIDGLEFVFARSDKDYDSYPQNTTLERAMLSCLREKGRLKRSGMFLLFD